MELPQVIALHVSPHDRILDVGCGNRDRTKGLPNEVVSVDAWENVRPDMLLDLSKELFPFTDRSFDVVLMIDFIEHLEKERGKVVLQDAKRVGKKIILFTPLWWTDNSDNVKNPSLWCFNNPYDYHKSLWTVSDFEGWQRIPFESYFLGVWSTP